MKIWVWKREENNLITDNVLVCLSLLASTFWPVIYGPSGFSLWLRRGSGKASLYAESTDVNVPRSHWNIFLGSINQKIENPFSKHTKHTAIFHKKRLKWFVTMQTNFSTKFSGVFAAGSSCPRSRTVPAAPARRWLISIPEPHSPGA